MTDKKKQDQARRKMPRDDIANLVDGFVTGPHKRLAILTATASRVDALLPSILDRAFKGEL